MRRWLVLLAVLSCTTEETCPEDALLLGERCALADDRCPDGFWLDDGCVDANGEPIEEPPPPFEGDADAFVDVFYQRLCAQQSACMEQRYGEPMVCLAEDTTPASPPGCDADLDAARTCLEELFGLPCAAPEMTWPFACTEVWVCPEVTPAQDARAVLLDERSEEASTYKALGAGLSIHEPLHRDRVEITLFAGNSYHLHTRIPSGGGRVNTVLRLFGPDGSLLQEVDDQPLRAGGDESALVYSATQTGTHTLEVLEYSEWEGDVDDIAPQGDAAFTYELFGARLDPSELESNDTIAQVQGEDSDAFFGRLWSHTGFRDLHGRLGADDSVDLWPLQFESTAELGLALWPDVGSSLSAELSVLDGDGNVLAVSHETSTGRKGWRVDESINLAVEAGAELYLAVRALSGEGAYTVRRALRAPAEAEVEPNQTLETATPVVMERVGGSDSAKIFGLADDDEDVYELLLPSSVGRLMSVSVRSLGVGSNADLSVRVLNGLGTVIARLPENDFVVQEGDPGKQYIELGQAGRVFLSVRLDDVGDHPTANQYFLAVAVQD